MVGGSSPSTSPIGQVDSPFSFHVFISLHRLSGRLFRPVGEVPRRTLKATVQFRRRYICCRSSNGRAPDSYSGGCRFKSLPIAPYEYNRSRCSAVGSAPDLGSGGREFESHHFDHGVVPKWFKGADLKPARRRNRAWVRIPPAPPYTQLRPAAVTELADVQDLGSCALRVWVRLPLAAPRMAYITISFHI